MERVRSGVDAGERWRQARTTKTMRALVDVLRAMAGDAERCMFCEDSRGVAVDHFRPKAKFRDKTFVWSNLLLVCDLCNRRKGDRFDLDADGHPLLIDPTAENPWGFLFYDSSTGLLTARFDPETGREYPKGRYTASEDVLPLNDSVVARQRKITYARLREIFSHLLEVLKAGDRVSRDLEDAAAKLARDDSHGLLQWVFLREGSEEGVFNELRQYHPETWKALQDMLTRELEGSPSSDI